MTNSIKLNHPAEALHAKSVAFRILAFREDPPQEVIAEGNGVLIINGPDADGMSKAFIEVTVLPDNQSRVGEWKMTNIPLYQRAVDSIELLADGKLTCFDPSISTED